MKMRTVLVIALGLAAAGGCKKKKDDNAAGGSAAGSAMTKPNEGSAGASTDPGSAGSATDTTAAAPKTGADLGKKYVECMQHVSDGKFDEFKTNCLADGLKVHEIDAPPAMAELNADQTIEMLKGYKTAFPDTKISPQLVLVNGSNIFAVNLVTGTHTGTFAMPGMPEVPATNKKIGMLMFERVAVDDQAKATEVWVFQDPASMMGQLGLLPKGTPFRATVDKGLEGAPVIVVAADDDKEKQNLELVKKGNEAFMAKKVSESMAHYADDAVESDQAGHEDMKGKKGIEAGANMFLGAFPDLKMEIPNQWAVGDYVVQHGTFSGTNTGKMGPMKPTKKPVSGSFAEVVKIEDGKVKQVWRFRNGMAMAMQLGLAPDPSKAGGDAKGGDKGDAPKMKKGG